MRFKSLRRGQRGKSLNGKKIKDTRGVGRSRRWKPPLGKEKVYHGNKTGERLKTSRIRPLLRSKGRNTGEKSLEKNRSEGRKTTDAHGRGGGKSRPFLKGEKKKKQQGKTP